MYTSEGIETTTGLLVVAYRHGELRLVYPIERGSASMIVALAAPFL